MPTLPTAEDVNKAREQASKTISEAVDQARTPLLAALGAGDLAAKTVVDTVNKVRTEINTRAESAKTGVQELPGELRSRLEPSELRKTVDSYTSSATQFYNDLASRGEDTFGKLKSQPPVQRAWDQVEAAQGRLGSAVEDVRGFADDVISKVTRRTRSAGEKAAETAEKAADTAASAVKDAAEAVKEAADEASQTIVETGDKAASTARSTARKTANKTAAAKSTATTKQSKADSNGKADD